MVHRTGTDEVVRSNLVAASLIRHLVGTKLSILSVLLSAIVIGNFGYQDPACFSLVRILVPTIDEDLQPGRGVLHTNRRVSGVLMLSALSSVHCSRYQLTSWHTDNPKSATGFKLEPSSRKPAITPISFFICHP